MVVILAISKNMIFSAVLSLKLYLIGLRYNKTLFDHYPFK